ncbi:MAG: hypothetical protein KA967_01880 [Methanoculleus sp.]|nr:hypothetical protein [Methanoculleus sp.]
MSRRRYGRCVSEGGAGGYDGSEAGGTRLSRGPDGVVWLSGGPAPSLCAGARSDEHFPADDDRRGSSRSWSSEAPDWKRGSGRRHDRKERDLPV